MGLRRIGLGGGVRGTKDSAASLLVQADAALYQTKAAGPDTVHMAALVKAGWIRRQAGWPAPLRW
ncbi:hypothetical protein DMX11_07235 [Pseudomonas sp. LB-090624]|nr:hypothetical protein DMX11_07235 [Pseudomonas sp. LB-090624]